MAIKILSYNQLKERYYNTYLLEQEALLETDEIEEDEIMSWEDYWDEHQGRLQDLAYEDRLDRQFFKE